MDSNHIKTTAYINIPEMANLRPTKTIHRSESTKKKRSERVTSRIANRFASSGSQFVTIAFGNFHRLLMNKRKILVTSALPYANGSIHLGHLVEYIQTDIWVRFQKMQEHEVHYVCADDTHGTPIMLRAEQEGITPKQLIDRVWKGT